MWQRNLRASRIGCQLGNLSKKCGSSSGRRLRSVVTTFFGRRWSIWRVPPLLLPDLHEQVASTPAAGWIEGRVGKQEGMQVSTWWPDRQEPVLRKLHSQQCPVLAAVHPLRTRQWWTYSSCSPATCMASQPNRPLTRCDTRCFVRSLLSHPISHPAQTPWGSICIVQAHIWRTVLVAVLDPPPNPDGNGWSLDDNGQLHVTWMTKDPAPTALLELISCRCVTGCSTQRCSCKTNNLPCTFVCGCKNCANKSPRDDSEDEQPLINGDEEGDDIPLDPGLWLEYLIMHHGLPLSSCSLGALLAAFICTVKPALNDHRFKRPPAFSDRFFMHGESAIQTALS